jgi:signal transduction histidine kinase
MNPIKKPFLFFYSLNIFFVLISVQNGFAQKEADSLDYYIDLALRPQSSNDFFNAYRYFNRSYKNHIKQNDIHKALKDLYYIASIDYKKGAYNASEKTAVSAIQLLDQHEELEKNTRFRKSFYTLLGMLYYEQGNKEKSLELYAKVLEITERARDSAVIYNNMSNVYKNANNNEKAKEVLVKAYDIAPRLKDTLTVALIIDNLGFAYTKLNNTSEGLYLMNKALKLREALNDTSTLYRSYSHLAKYYYNVDSLNKSKINALKALELAESLNSATYKSDALGFLTKLSQDTYVKAYKNINDSLVKAEKERTNKFALMQYDFSEYERKALESELENVKLKSSQQFYILLAIVMVFAAVFLYFILKSKHKKEKLKQVFDTESRISKQIHDEVANDVFQVMTKLENKDEKREGLINDLHHLYYRTRDISKEHSIIDTDYPFIDYLGELLESFNNADTNVIVKGISEVSWDRVPELNRITIYKVLQELLINMKKHSHASLVVVVFKKEHKNIQINYSDNGVGSDLKTHIGLQNTENRIHSINGTITFDTNPNKGFKAKISI